MPRHFGIEVEFGGSRQAAVDAISSIGLRTRLASYSEWSREIWLVATDSTVSGGGELKSRVLDFDSPEDREEVTKVINAMREAGCHTDPSAGIHIHIAADGMTAEQLASVAKSYIRYEDVLWRLASSGWEKIRPRALTNHAKRLPVETVKRLARVRGDGPIGRELLNRAWYNDRNIRGDRYRAVNFDAYFRKGTIEWRMFNSSMNPKRIQAYIALCMGIVTDARAGYNRALGKTRPLGMMAESPEQEAEGTKQFKRLLLCLKDCAGLTKEDRKLLEYCWKDSKPQRVPSSIYG